MAVRQHINTLAQFGERNQRATRADSKAALQVLVHTKTFAEYFVELHRFRNSCRGRHLPSLFLQGISFARPSDRPIPAYRPAVRHPSMRASVNESLGLKYWYLRKTSYTHSIHQPW